MAASRNSETAKKRLPARGAGALERLERLRALQTLVRGALPAESLRRLLKNALPPRTAREMPPEVWSSFAVGIALESPVFAEVLAQELHDRLAWDETPSDMDEWWRLVREKPLEALWMAALSEDRVVKKEFRHIVQHCLENFRSSPENEAPSWEFVEGILDVHGNLMTSLRDVEKRAESAERRLEAEEQRLAELRGELKRLRRENADLRSARAAAEKRNTALSAAPVDDARLRELERRALKAEKEREHLLRELERKAAPRQTPQPERIESPRSAAPEDPQSSVAPAPTREARILQQLMRKLFAKGKIGASHTHEDNLLRSFPDHEKGIAKDAIALLYREGILLPKPTTADPHVSLSPEKTPEILAMVEGRIENPRILRFVTG
jgi:hypothetical protein